ncbi:ATP-grasp fold amidoligase family protein [Providencia sp. wls1914]|uniref:ATP-grasp fold amidoligase family protein n=1 Tax=Providencia sp. wls1914 TaxID=2675156 RepID=UPI0012B63027|nr:ATP-grasp fold amidoligase family protein [Providencia sp. wls1914]MTC70891.1 glycosyl transferase [Providencia sp. wls1914]
MKKIAIKFKKTLSRISPLFTTHILYLIKFKKKLNLKKPKTFNEKILHLKFNHYKNNQLVSKCADKYRVREYVREKGCADILNELIFVCNKPEEIPIEKLPSSGFVIKCNHGAGYNLIVLKKSDFDAPQSLKKIRNWLNDEYWETMAEIHYKHIEKKIICEKLLINQNNELPEDYKVYCFNGEPKFVMICSERESGSPKYYFVDKEFNILPFGYAYQFNPNPIIHKPLGFESLFHYSKMLSNDFPFVRVDFYIIDGTIYFGELTFTPAAGLDTRISNTLNPNGDLIMGDFLKID